MNTEESEYGFIKNTIALPSDSTTQTEIQKYIVGSGIPENSFIDLTNPNRIILKIVNNKNQEPIKATGLYNELTGKVEITITYTQYGIKKVTDEIGQELTISKQNGIILANSGDNSISKGKHVITITDNKNNTKEIIVYKSTIYVSLYSDGTLTFSTSENLEPNKELVKFYGEISDDGYGEHNNYAPWLNEINIITSVNFKDRIYPNSTAYWFAYCSKLTTMNNMQNLNTNKVTNMSKMFNGCYGLTSIDLRYFNTTKVTDMSGMFYNCEKLNSLSFSSFDTRNVTNMSEMFYNCRGLTSLDLRRFNTENVTDMSKMFSTCQKLSKLDLSSFDTSNVVTMKRMFWHCESLISLNLTNFNTSNVTNMEEMFVNCDILKELNLSSFDTSKVENMSAMFWSCKGLTSLDLSSFNTRNTTNMSYMFYYCSNLKTIYVGRNWITSNVNISDMFTNCATNKVTLKN